MNPKANGQLQTEWGWLIAVYLFLGGVGGGAYTMAAVNSFLGAHMDLAVTVGLWIGFPALLVGSLFLVADLGVPMRAVMAGMKPGTSWIARGFWIISIFMGISFLHLVLHHTGKGGDVMLHLAVAGIVFGFLTMAYTGILLGSSKGIPFWGGGAVPAVFVTSGLVTGTFATMLGVAASAEGDAAFVPLGSLAVEAAVLLGAELLTVFFFIQTAFKQPDSRESVERILAKSSFVVGDIVLGLLLPLALMLFITFGMPDPDLGTIKGTAAVGAALGLIGGLLLRHGVLVCGTLPSLNIAGFSFRRIARPKEPKPGQDVLVPQ